MVDDDVLFGFRLRLLDLAPEFRDVGEACRLFGVHHSTYYPWKHGVRSKTRDSTGATGNADSETARRTGKRVDRSANACAPA